MSQVMHAHYRESGIMAYPLQRGIACPVTFDFTIVADADISIIFFCPL